MTARRTRGGVPPPKGSYVLPRPPPCGLWSAPPPPVGLWPVGLPPNIYVFHTFSHISSYAFVRIFVGIIACVVCFVRIILRIVCIIVRIVYITHLCITYVVFYCLNVS